MADPWAKIWWTWYSSRSHLGLSGTAMALGAPLMLLCKASPEADRARHSDGVSDGHNDTGSDTVYARTRAGKPVSIQAIAATIHFSVSDVKAALDELVDVGTVTVSADGAYGLVNFWKYQESPSAARMRKLRANSDGESARHSDGVSDEKKAEGRSKKTEGRGDAAAQLGRADEPAAASGLTRSDVLTRYTAVSGRTFGTGWETAAETIMLAVARERDPSDALDALLAYHFGPGGPVAAGRIQHPDPGKLAQYVARELDIAMGRTAPQSRVDHGRAGTAEEHAADLEHDWLDAQERGEAQA